MLSIGDDATLVGVTAAWWWHLVDEPPAVLTVAVPLERRPAVREGVRVLRRPIDAADRILVDDVAVTKRAFTVLDACAELGLREGSGLMDRALQRGRVGLDELREVHARTAGRRGTAVARELLGLAAGGARSEAERIAGRSLRGAGIGGWRADVAVDLPDFGRAVVDIAFPALRVAVEVDGWAFHRDLDAFLRDAARQNALVLAGWTVIRTNWHELRWAPDTFLTAVRRAVAA